MPLETGTYISDLVSTNPTGPDGLGQADDHLRLIKSVLKATFPNITGAVSAAQADLSNGYTPIGGIILWSGSIATIPTNWHLCDGSTVNGHVTPNLKNLFVIGADADLGTHPPNTTGGSTVTDSQGAHTHTGSTGAYTLTVADIPAHAHGVTDPGHVHSGGSVFNGVDLAGAASATQATNIVSTGSATTGITIQNTGGGGPHSHTISSDGAHTHNVTPPYYALAYIMRVS